LTWIILRPLSATVHTVTFSAFAVGLPLEAIRKSTDRALDRLNPFENGTPLKQLAAAAGSRRPAMSSRWPAADIVYPDLQPWSSPTRAWIAFSLYAARSEQVRSELEASLESQDALAAAWIVAVWKGVT